MIVRDVGEEVAAAMIKATEAVADCEDESTTEKPIEKLPLMVGAPEMIPVLGARASPAGSCPDAMLQV